MALPMRQEVTPPADMPKEAKNALNIDTALIETLAELLQRSGLTEIEVNEGDVKIRVTKEPAPITATMPAMAAPVMPAPPAAEPNEARSTAPSDNDHPGAVRAPMVGTAYLTPEPGSDPFVAVGTEVSEGQTLLIVEAMKVMNPIRAPRSGRIAKILVTNGDPVEYDELLLIID